MINSKKIPTLSKLNQAIYFVISLIIVGFGQPVWGWFFSMVAGFFGYALFWRILLDYPKSKSRFWISTSWFFCVQLVQLYWLVSHPYLYIYLFYLVLAFFLGIQFGVIGILVNPKKIKEFSRLLLIASVWVLMEWGRLFILAGISWNPVGMALGGNIYSLQMASFWGVYGLSFMVIVVNLLALKAWSQYFSFQTTVIWVLVAAIPYIYGGIHLGIHSSNMIQYEKEKPFTYHTVVVQTGFPVEESLSFWESKQMIAYVIDEWKQILKNTKKQMGKSIDLIVLPEFTVPYGTYSPVFPYEVVKKAFGDILGHNTENFLPALIPPLAYKIEMKDGSHVWMVNNAFWVQGIANIYNTDVVAGLEDAEEVALGEIEYYNSAQYFRATPRDGPIAISRYEKRVLVPMGEYIPFSFCKQLSADYGICGSLTHGKEAKVFGKEKVPFGISICYEETIGYLMRENRLLGAELLVNLTSDVWYPNSLLPQQHFDHARFRTVENGFPLIRACNTGITCGIDSLGRVIGILGETPQQQEWLSDSLYLNVPTYTYTTIYSKVGDKLILGISLFFILLSLFNATGLMRFNHREY